MPNPFRRSNRNAMGSNAITDQAQGGGNKKAGFPHTVGRDSWASVYIQNRPLSVLQFTVFPDVMESKPIGSTYRPNTYFHVPGTGR